LSEASPNIGGVPIVHIKDGQVFANGRDVAEYFGKEHFNVLADIRKLSAELSPENTGVWFEPSTSTYRQKTGLDYRDMPAFDMGFVQFWTMPLSGRGRVLWERASKRSCGH
jgi:hypothetical protein